MRRGGEHVYEALKLLIHRKHGTAAACFSLASTPGGRRKAVLAKRMACNSEDRAFQGARWRP